MYLTSQTRLHYIYTDNYKLSKNNDRLEKSS